MTNLRNTPNREVIMRDFWWDGAPLYRDQLGWQKRHKQEARSLVTKEIFDFEIVLVGLNLSFYYVENDTYYGLHTEQEPIEFKLLPRDRTQDYIDLQCIANTHADGEVLYSFENREDIWDGIKIDGMSLEYVLDHSVILCLN